MKGHDDKYRIENNITFIAGVDEAGRGPLAGPIVVAAVILNPKVNLLLVDDSKKLSKKKRELALNEIKDNSLAISIGMASPEEIDELNILEATKLAIKRALDNLDITLELVLIDHVKLNYEVKDNTYTFDSKYVYIEYILKNYAVLHSDTAELLFSIKEAFIWSL